MRVVTVARKPVAEGTVTANVLVHGTGALSIGPCRVGNEKITQHGRKAKEGTGWEDHWHNALEGGRSWTGRWPANVVLAHRPGCEIVGERRVATGTAHREKSGGKTIFSETEKKPLPNMTYADVDGMETVPDWRCQVGCPVASMDGQSGVLTSGTGAVKRASSRDIHGNRGSAFGAESRREGEPMVSYGDSGGASRFFKQVSS